MTRPSSFTWKRAVPIVLIAIFLFVLTAFAVGYMTADSSGTTKVRINSTVYHLQLADSYDELAQGLSGVEELSPNGGLLMDFGNSSKWGIWMKDMKIPLDILWLDEGKKVVYIQENADPKLGTRVIMQPETPSRYVLELAAGSIAKTEIEVGQQANFVIKGDAK